jgi:hypothetical protein
MKLMFSSLDIIYFFYHFLLQVIDYCSEQVSLLAILKVLGVNLTTVRIFFTHAFLIGCTLTVV